MIESKNHYHVVLNQVSIAHSIAILILNLESEPREVLEHDHEAAHGHLKDAELVEVRLSYHEIDEVRNLVRFLDTLHDHPFWDIDLVKLLRQKLFLGLKAPN